MAPCLLLPAETVRERVLLATAELWAEAGYEGLDVDSICRRAGVEKNDLGSELPDRESLARAALEVPVAAMVDLVAEQYGPDRSEPESCALGIVAILEMMAANPAYAFVLYIGSRQAGKTRRVATVSRTAHQLMVAMLERLGEGSDIGRPPLTAGVGAMGAAEIALRREVVAGRVDCLPHLAGDVVYAAITPFVGQKEGLRLAALSRQLVAGTDR
jgi:AcrR family transcriptional regulator